MFKFIKSFKSIGCWALFLSFVAITSLEISYVFGGLNWLDALVFLLIPALILLIIQIILACNTQPRNYSVAFTILIACIVFALFHKSNVEVCCVGDTYHIFKVVAFSIKNSFFAQAGDCGREGCISDFVESFWGIFWRWFQWDYIIVLLQTLPIILVWHQLVRFFQNQKVKTYPALLATVVVMTLEMLWAQQGSPFIDSIVGMFVGITLLLCYSYLTPPYERRFSYLAGLIFVSGLCIVSKPTGICVGVLGFTIAFVLGFRSLNNTHKKILVLTVLPPIAYLVYHQSVVQIQKGVFFYPYVDQNNSFQIWDGYVNNWYTHLPLYYWIRDHAFNSKFLYILSSWLADYKRDTYITPAPYVRGNGLAFTYFVIPTLILWLFQHKNIIKLKLWKDPRLSIFVVIFLYYYIFEGSVDVRFALGYNIFILSWCLSYLWQCLEQWRFKWSRQVTTFTICLLLLMSTGSYLDSILGLQFERHILSPLAIQKEIFPHHYGTEIRTYLIQKLTQEQSMQ